MDIILAMSEEKLNKAINSKLFIKRINKYQKDSLINIKSGDKCFVSRGGTIVGYFIINAFSYKQEFEHPVTGAFMDNGYYIFCNPTFYKIYPVKKRFNRNFANFKYKEGPNDFDYQIILNKKIID